ncbi:MAG: hypothetical protein PHY28_08485 [Dehalococcoidales bacterium]|nr:hypothetical protein [Dehalococcoidales bacterium]
MTITARTDKVSSNNQGGGKKISCYFRHLRDVLAEANIEVTPQNRKNIDQAFHKIVGVENKECPATWKKLKQEWLTDEKKRKELAKLLMSALAQK